MQHRRPGRRARSATSCHRCKHRKQRCDNAFPTCTACAAVGATCSYDNPVYPVAHVQVLEKRVQELEGQLREHQQLQTSTSLSYHTGSPAAGSATATPTTAVTTMFRPATRATIIVDKDDGSEAAFDMLPSAFLGVSSGLPLAKALQTAIGSPTVSHSERINRSCDIPVEPASPDPSVGLLFVQTYLLKVHPKHPFLSPRRIMQWHDSIEGRASSTSTTFSASGSVSTKIEYFNLHLVYAIGARYMQLSQNRYTCNPEVGI